MVALLLVVAALANDPEVVRDEDVWGVPVVGEARLRQWVPAPADVGPHRELRIGPSGEQQVRRHPPIAIRVLGFTALGMAGAVGGALAVARVGDAVFDTCHRQTPHVTVCW